jgi:undecaprenyl-diphosphatase
MRNAIASLPLVAFIVLAIGAHRREQLPGDVRFERWVQSWSIPGFDRLCWATNWFFQSGPVITGTILVLLWCLYQGDKAATALVAGTLLLRFINPAIKAIVASDRPSAALVHVDGSQTGFGFPSGHTSGAVLLTGTVAWLITRRQTDWRLRSALWTVAVLIVIQTGLGRIWVGAHWPSDVIGAVLWSVPILLLCITMVERYRWTNRR